MIKRVTPRGPTCSTTDCFFCVVFTIMLYESWAVPNGGYRAPQVDPTATVCNAKPERRNCRMEPPRVGITEKPISGHASNRS
jgi:hypothetical protein